jgi:hypothetical protein
LRRAEGLFGFVVWLIVIMRGVLDLSNIVQLSVVLCIATLCGYTLAGYIVSIVVAWIIYTATPVASTVHVGDGS